MVPLNHSSRLAFTSPMSSSTPLRAESSARLRSGFGISATELRRPATDKGWAPPPPCLKAMSRMAAAKLADGM